MGQGFFRTVLNALAGAGTDGPKKRGLIDIIDDINKILNLILKSLVLLSLVIFVIYPLVSFMQQKDDGITIYPFETNGIPNLDGKYLSNLLLYDLHNFNDINITKETSYIISKNLPVNLSAKTPDPNATLHDNGLVIPIILHQTLAIPAISIKGSNNQMLSQLGTVNFEGSSISIGNIILLSKQISGGSFLNCSIQKYGSSIVLIGILDDRNSSHRDISVWQVNRTLKENNLSAEELIPSMIKDLAYQIDYEMGQKNSRSDIKFPKSWHTFKNILEGKEAYLEFLSTNNSAYLDNAKIRALEAKDSEPTYDNSSDMLFDIGIAYLDLEKYNTSMEIFRDIGNVKPFESALGIGLVESKLNKYPESINNFSKAILLNPDSYVAWYNKGINLQYLNKTYEAIDAYDNASKSKEIINAPSEKSRALVKKGNAIENIPYGTLHRKHDMSLIEYREASKSDDSNAEAHFGIANSLYLIGKQASNNSSVEFYKDAEAEYKEAIRHDPLDAELYNGEGNALYAQNKSNESLREYENAIILDPDMAKAYNGKGNALEELKKYNEARDAFMRARQIDPSTPTYQYNLENINTTIEGLSNISDHAHP